MEIPSLLAELVKQAPSLVVLFMLVDRFLKRDKERDMLLQQMHGEHILARGESRQAIRENTASNQEVTKALMIVSESVRAGSQQALRLFDQQRDELNARREEGRAR